MAIQVEDLDTLSDHQLMTLHGQLLQRLRARGVIRTGNAPTGDYAEYIVAKALNGTLETNSRKGWDVSCEQYGQVQVKSRVVMNIAAKDQRQLSVFRSFGFDHLAVVLFNADYTLLWAAVLPKQLVQDKVFHQPYVNGHIMFADDKLLDVEGVVNLSDDLRGVMENPATLSPAGAGGPAE